MNYVYVLSTSRLLPACFPLLPLYFPSTSPLLPLYVLSAYVRTYFPSTSHLLTLYFLSTSPLLPPLRIPARRPFYVPSTSTQLPFNCTLLPFYSSFTSTLLPICLHSTCRLRTSRLLPSTSTLISYYVAGAEARVYYCV